MSCGEPHETDCRQVLEEVFLYLDGENTLGDLDRDAVRVHLEECAPCLQEYGLEKALIKLVARCAGGDPAPEALRQQVLHRIAEVRIELSVVEYHAE